MDTVDIDTCGMYINIIYIMRTNRSTRGPDRDKQNAYRNQTSVTNTYDNSHSKI